MLHSTGSKSRTWFSDWTTTDTGWITRQSLISICLPLSPSCQHSQLPHDTTSLLTSCHFQIYPSFPCLLALGNAATTWNVHNHHPLPSQWCWLLIPRNHECYLIWQKRCCRYDNVRILRWGASSGLSYPIQVHAELLSHSVVSDSVPHHGLQPTRLLWWRMQEFSRQEYWSGCHFLPPGDLPDSGMEPVSLSSPALAGGFFTNWNILHAAMKIDRRSYALQLRLGIDK